MRTANPALNAKTFEGFSRTSANAMTIEGTVNKTGLLLILLIAAAAHTWKMFYEPVYDIGGRAGLLAGSQAVSMWMWGGLIGAFIFAMITIFKKTWAAYTGPAYAVLEGFALGGISAMMEARYPGIVIQAVGLTFGTLLALLMAYKSGAIQATENFKLGVVAATGGIGILYFVSFALGFFGIRIPFVHSSGLFGIGFSMFVVVVAALNLVLDFDFIEQGAEKGAPKYMEWYAAFGLMVTLVWLYIEILHLLAKLRNRR